MERQSEKGKEIENNHKVKQNNNKAPLWQEVLHMWSGAYSFITLQWTAEKKSFKTVPASLQLCVHCVYSPWLFIALLFCVCFFLVVNTGKLSSIPHPPSDSNKNSWVPVTVLSSL